MNIPSMPEWALALRQITANLASRIHKLEMQELGPWNVSQAVASADLTLTTSNQDVVGATITIGPGTYQVTGYFDFLTSNDDLDNGTTARGVLSVDGVAEASEAISTLVRIAGVTRLRTVVSTLWIISCANSCIVKLMARKTVGGTGTSTLRAINTNITAIKLSS